MRSRAAESLLLASTVLAFGGYAALLPVVPLWVSDGGSGEFGAGTTTGVFILTTVATQLTVPWMLGRFGHRVVLVCGILLLGAPTPVLALSADLPAVLAVSAVRGAGFGMLTVAGSALVAELVPPAEHGRAAARYGLAVGLPQLTLLPSGVAVVEWLGFTTVFLAAGLVPLLGMLLALGVRVRRHDGAEPEPAKPAGRFGWAATGPVVAMLTCSIAQGGLITFIPLAAPDVGLYVSLALFTTAAGGLLGRLATGHLVDRRGVSGRLLVPGMLTAAAGMGVEILAVPATAWLLVTGATAVGIGFGLVQNDALTALFAGGGAARYGHASAVWNIAFDAGTGVGATGLGAVAEPFGFPTAFGASSLVLMLATPVVAVASRQVSEPGRPRSRRATSTG